MPRKFYDNKPLPAASNASFLLLNLFRKAQGQGSIKQIETLLSCSDQLINQHQNLIYSEALHRFGLPKLNNKADSEYHFISTDIAKQNQLYSQHQVIDFFQKDKTKKLRLAFKPWSWITSNQTKKNFTNRKK